MEALYMGTLQDQSFTKIKIKEDVACSPGIFPSKTKTQPSLLLVGHLSGSLNLNQSISGVYKTASLPTTDRDEKITANVFQSPKEITLFSGLPIHLMS